jgi:hypothetical protein
MGKPLAQPGVLAHMSPGSARTRDTGEMAIVGATLATAALIGILGMAYPSAQEALRIRVATTIVVAPESQTSVAIEVGPPSAVPPRSFLSVRGLPPAVLLTDAHAIGPGSWAVPLAGLSALKAIVPSGVSGQAEVTISLIAIDGQLLNQTKTILIIRSRSASDTQGLPPAAASTAKTSPPIERVEPPSRGPPAPAAEKRAPTPYDTERALEFLRKGQDAYAAGNVAAARLFYERAADLGLIQGALALAATFDPDELARLQVLGGVKPDPAAARRWYERARELGASEAEGQFGSLKARER